MGSVSMPFVNPADRSFRPGSVNTTNKSILDDKAKHLIIFRHQDTISIHSIKSLQIWCPRPKRASSNSSVDWESATDTLKWVQKLGMDATKQYEIAPHLPGGLGGFKLVNSAQMDDVIEMAMGLGRVFTLVDVLEVTKGGQKGNAGGEKEKSGGEEDRAMVDMMIFCVFMFVWYFLQQDLGFVGGFVLTLLGGGVLFGTLDTRNTVDKGGDKKKGKMDDEDALEEM